MIYHKFLTFRNIKINKKKSNNLILIIKFISKILYNINYNNYIYNSNK